MFEFVFLYFKDISNEGRGFCFHQVYKLRCIYFVAGYPCITWIYFHRCVFLFLKIIMANSLRRLRLDLHLVFAKAQ